MLDLSDAGKYSLSIDIGLDVGRRPLSSGRSAGCLSLPSSRTMDILASARSVILGLDSIRLGLRWLALDRPVIYIRSAARVCLIVWLYRWDGIGHVLRIPLLNRSSCLLIIYLLLVLLLVL